MSNKNPSQKEDMLGRCMIFGTQIWKMEFSGDLLMQLSQVLGQPILLAPSRLCCLDQFKGCCFMLEINSTTMTNLHQVPSKTS